MLKRSYPILMLMTAAASVLGQMPIRADEQVPALQGYRVDEKLGDYVPVEAFFTDENGKTVQLRDYLDGEKPVILTLNYFNCPMMCTVQLNNLLQTVDRALAKLGDEYEIITVSFDPQEDHTLARSKKDIYVAALANQDAGERGWHFLTGKQDAITQLADSVGYVYRWNEDLDPPQWQHPAVLMVLSPTGQISRYIHGITYEPKSFRLSLVEASEGKIVPTIGERFVFMCYVYDPQHGKYVPFAMGMMKVGGALVLTAVVVFLSVMWLSERRRRQPAA